MRKQLLTSAAVLALSAGAAFASDLPTHKGPPPAPTPAPYSWTGFYLGGEVGYGWGEEGDNFDSVTGYPLDHFGVSGPKGGIKAGYNQQYNMLVLGIEADLEASGIHGSKGTTFQTNEGTGVSSLSMRNTWQGSLRARAGVAFDRLLIYATGGLAVANDKESYYVNDPSFGPGGTIWSGSQTNTLWGWTIGGGGEYAIDDHWRLTAELRYASFAHASYSIPASLSSSGTGTSFQAGFNETLAQIGLDYRF